MTSQSTSPASVVIDANVVIALCAKEADKLAAAEAKMKEYAQRGCEIYAPGVIVAECLFVLCNKLRDSVLTAAEHSIAVQGLIALMAAVKPPPNGDADLIGTAEAIRGNLTCKRSADGIYLALASHLNAISSTEIVTFDQGIASQATSSSLGLTVVVLPTV